jgi:hypothetical protein
VGVYKINSVDLVRVVSKALGVIALGDKAESNSITLVFGKKGVTVEAINTVAAYQADLVATVVTPEPMRMHILPELLIAYAKAHKELTLEPSKQNLKVSSGKNFSAEIYFIGENESVEIEKPDENNEIENIAKSASRLLSMVGGFRNRTDQQVLAVALNWSKGSLELTLGDTHHAVVIDAVVKGKSSGKITMNLNNLSRIMEIGQNYASTEARFIAWSETEYLAIANQAESVFVADAARSVIKEGQRQTKVLVDTKDFKDMVETLTSAVDEKAQINFKLSKDRVVATVKTGASSAKHQLKIESLKGKEQAVTVTIHHLKDCLGTMTEKNTTISVFNNMLAFESKNKDMVCTAAMASVGTKT